MLPSRFGYDEEGSHLYEEIMRLPEYYLPDAECKLLDEYGHEISAASDASEVVDLGAGNARKTEILLEEMSRAGTLRAYTAIDVSPQPMKEAARRIKSRWSTVDVTTVCGDYFSALSWVKDTSHRRLIAFMGSTLGNMLSKERADFLQVLRNFCGPCDRLLLCVDLNEPKELVEAAYTAGYSGSRPVRRLFALNRLEHLNKTFKAN